MVCLYTSKLVCYIGVFTVQVIDLLIPAVSYVHTFFVCVSWLSSLYTDVRMRLEHMLYIVGGLVCHAIH
jgi:hypothetical protein